MRNGNLLIDMHVHLARYEALFGTDWPSVDIGKNADA